MLKTIGRKLALRRDTVKLLTDELSAVAGGRGTLVSIRTSTIGTPQLPTRDTCDVQSCIA